MDKDSELFVGLDRTLAAALWQAKTSRPTERPRQHQTNLRKCGTQPAQKSMSTVVESPASNFAHQLHAICFINVDEKTLAGPKRS